MPQADPVLVVGAGAIGSVYAVKLSVRHPVTVVARRDHAEAIRAGGLRLVGRETVTARVEAVIERVTGAAAACGLARIAMAPSAITGATGNQEFFLHLRAAG